MFTLWIIFANSAFAVVKADLVVKPHDTEAVIGDSTHFDCASNVDRNEVNWYHYAVGAKDHEDICLYCMGTVHPQYEHRIEVTGNASTGNSRLRFKSVQRKDAGRYVCLDNGGIGELASAELVILESSPTCTSNMMPDGVLGPNSCGLEPDTLRLSCHVSHHSNIPPIIKWRKTKSENPVNRLSCQNIGNRMTCNLTMTVDLGLNGVSYICETNRSSTTQYKCQSDIIRVVYAKINNSTKETTEDAEEKVYCSVNSSLSCRHTWKWFDGVYEEIVAYGSPLIAHKPGWHKCEAECIIRGKRCTVLSKLVHVVSEQKSLSMPVAIAVGCLLMIVVEIVIVGLVCSCCLKKSRFNRDFWRRKEETLLDGERSENEKHHSSIGSILVTKGKLIRGITILDNELYVLSEGSSEVEVFDCNTLNPSRHWMLNELILPSDIASCKENRCLYIMDWKGDLKSTEVLCVAPNGTFLRNWETGDDYGDLISVTYEKNIVVTCYGRNEFNEYSPEGIMICKISLRNVRFPKHAMKLTNGDFMVSSGDISHVLHRVCIVGADGRVKNSFGEEQGSDLDRLDQPMKLAICADGSVAVLDTGNRRVLLLDKDLQFNRVLLSKKEHKLQHPTRLLLDESNNQLFVAGSHKGAGAILCFPFMTVNSLNVKDA